MPQLQDMARNATDPKTGKYLGLDISSVTPQMIQRLLAHPDKVEMFDKTFNLKPGTGKWLLQKLQGAAGTSADEGETDEAEGEESDATQ